MFAKLFETLFDQSSIREIALWTAHQVYRIQVNGESLAIDSIDQTQVCVRRIRVHPRHGLKRIERPCRIDGVDDLKKYLVTEKKHEFAEAIVRRLLAYSLGRSLEWTDRATVANLTDRFTTQHEFRLRPLIEEIVLSKAFQSR